ncbi:type II toxin-antitoxin system RelE/ParE family toxin [Endozoicomonas sp. ALD040]|uniref:type II toxin-antitoxin system RelE/ParE family toxin n=1 Tax=unclassified Endozoicomonas TaxID=2644528 RepID=UPI003BB14743
MQAKAEKLMDFPKIGRVGRVVGTRELVAWGNYIIVYKVSETTIRILRILHAAQQWPLSK